MTEKTDAWGDAKKVVDARTSGGLFVKLKNDGDTAVGAFVGDPHIRETFWTGKGTETYDPAVHGKDAKTSVKVKLNFFAPGAGMRIFEMNTNIFKDVLIVREKYGLDKWLFEVKRNGAAGDMKTTYAVLPEREMTKEELAELAAAEVLDLKEKAPDAAEFSDDEDDSGAVINAEQVAAFVARLRKADLADVKALLADFEITKVRDLPAPAAAMFEKQLAALEAGEDDEDPFG